MIPCILDDIDEHALQALIDGERRESRTIEYKRQEPPSRQKLFAEACALANAVGGDLIIGIEEDDGLPVGVPGIEVKSVDEKCHGLEQSISNALEPNLRGLQVKPVPLENGRHAFVIRIPQSLDAPHRVRSNYVFYGRTSNGKYTMDVYEIRSSIMASRELGEAIHAFRNDRIQQIRTNHGAFKIGTNTSAVVVLHLIPQESLVRRSYRDARDISPLAQDFRPFEAFLGMNSAFNGDGFATYSPRGDNLVYAYTQVFRDGKVELVGHFDTDRQKGILVSDYEWYVVTAGKSVLRGLRKLGFDFPVHVAISLLSVGGVKLVVKGADRGSPKRFSRAEVLPPSQEVRANDEIRDVMRPAFDVVWNAAGYSRSLNYSEGGEWNPRGV